MFDKGSTWGKWDLQVHTILDDDYVSLNNYAETIKRANREKWDLYVSKVGGEDNAKLFDSKAYFGDASIDKKERCTNYIRNFFAFLSVYRPDLRCVALTDHNYWDDQLIDIFVKYSEETHCKVIPGVEYNCSGIHMLALFRTAPYSKRTFSSGIQTFLTTIGVRNQKTGRVLTVTQNSIEEVISEIKKRDGLVIYPHCNSSNGLFNQSDKTNMSNTFNLQEINILQENNQEQCVSVSAYIKSNRTLVSLFCMTTGSDSRSLRDVGKPDKDGNYLWIKSDPTFDGLMQIAYEPEERIRIQSHSPYDDFKKVYFDSIAVLGSSKFILPDTKIDLNRELVTLIGGRGSGKSVLLDTIAFLNEEHLKVDRNNKKKVIEYYRTNELRTDPRPSFTFTALLVDKDLKATEVKKDLVDNTDFGLPFLYIGQEQLSSLATNDIELTREVCELLAIDNSKASMSTVIADSREVLSAIDNLITENGTLESSYPDYDRLTDFETWLANRIAKLEYQAKKLSSDKTRKVLVTINSITERASKLKELNQKAEVMEVELSSLEINHSLKQLEREAGKIYKDYKLPLLDIGIQVKSVKSLKDKIEKDLITLRKDYTAQKALLLSMGIKEDVSGLLQTLESIQTQISSLKKVLEIYLENNKSVVELIKTRNQFLVKVKSFLDQTEKQIGEKFELFKKSKAESTQDEKDLFEKIIEGVDVAGETIFKQDYFLSYVLTNFVDKRKITNVEQLKTLISGSSESGVANEVTTKVLFDWASQKMDELTDEYFITNGRRGLTEFIFTKWDEFLMVKAVVKLNSKPVELLSIGQRGTLLLKMFLATSGGGQILMIDQPEDNLDNDFIMNELVPLIRRIKKNRQVIMATHNANLVVNGDSEQVIVASLGGEVPYISGSLENSVINKSVKDILEGGEEAFKQRERKYNIVR